MQQHTTDDITWFQFASFAPFADLITHGVFARSGGVSAAPYASLNAGLTVGDDPARVAENRARIVATLPGHPVLITAHPVHGARVIAVTDAARADQEAHATVIHTQADAMITQTRGLGLFWAYADCTPIMIVDPAHAAIALVHAGWGGTSEAVAPAALMAMRERFGTRPDEVFVGIGPSIGPCCYEVDTRVQDAFAANDLAQANACFATVMVPDGQGDARPSLRLDLPAANRAQLRTSGVPEDRIEVSEFCTSCRRDLFFSHRTENGRTGRFAVVIGLR